VALRIDGEEPARRRRPSQERERDCGGTEHALRIAETAPRRASLSRFLPNPHGSLTLLLGITGTLGETRCKEIPET